MRPKPHQHGDPLIEDDRHVPPAAEQWDGAALFKFASTAAFPLKEHEWNGLKELFPLPDESRPDFDVFRSILQGLMDEKGYYLPPERTMSELSRLSKKLKTDLAHVKKTLMNRTISNYFIEDGKFWFMVLSSLKSADEKLLQYAKQIGSTKAGTGQDWAHLDRFANMVETILNRHGLSLAVPRGNNERRRESEALLQKLFKLANCALKDTTARSIVSRITDSNKTKTV